MVKISCSNFPAAQFAIMVILLLTRPSSAAAQSSAVPGYPTVPAIPAASYQLGVRNTSFGTILTDGLGRSLYMFEGDTSPSASLCLGACETVWIPFIIQGGQAGQALPAGSIAVQQTLIGAFVRSDGFTQVSYSGHPLYYYSGDAGSSTSTNGEGLNQFGSFWYLIDPSGRALTIPVIQ